MHTFSHDDGIVEYCAACAAGAHARRKATARRAHCPKAQGPLCKRSKCSWPWSLVALPSQPAFRGARDSMGVGERKRRMRGTHGGGHQRRRRTGIAGIRPMAAG